MTIIGRLLQANISFDGIKPTLLKFSTASKKFRGILTKTELLLRSSQGDRLAGRVAGRHLDVDAGLREDLVDAVSLGADDVAVLRLLYLDRDGGHLALLRQIVVRLEFCDLRRDFRTGHSPFRRKNQLIARSTSLHKLCTANRDSSPT